MPTLPPGSDPHPAPDAGAPSPIEVEPVFAEPEVRVHAGEVHVTLAVPEIQADDLGHYVGSNLVLIWSKADPEHHRLLVHLPCDVQSETSVVRFTNGVFDLAVLAARPARLAASDSPTSTDSLSE